MKNRKVYLTAITILITLSLAGLIGLQFYYISNAYEQREESFRNNVLLALNNAAISLEATEAARNLVKVAAGDSALLPDKEKKNIETHVQFFYKSANGPESNRTANGLKPQQIIVSYRDSDKVLSRDTMVFLKSSTAINNFEQKKKSLSTRNNLHYVIDSAANQGNCPSRVIDLTGINQNGKFKLVTKVVEQLSVSGQTPIEKRVPLKALDSMLTTQFSSVGIDIPYSFGVFSEAANSLVLNSTSADTAILRASNLRARLFPSDFFQPGNSVIVYFPNQNLYLFRTVLPVLGLSVLFIGVIAFGFLFTLRTIIRQKQFALQVSDFVNNMTHEFKTPISTISLASEAITKPVVAADAEKLTKYNKIIRDEIDRMKNQVEKILQMAVIEEGDYELDIQEVNIHDVITSVVQNHLLRIESSQGRIYKNLNAGSAIVSGDKVHLTNIINNIVDNSIKYSPGRIEISISTQNADGKIFIRITDQGIGIAREYTSKVFEKYFRVPTGNKHDIKGYGLGLSYVKLMTTAHGGTVTIDSEPQKGTTVEIGLPASAGTTVKQDGSI